MYTYIYIYVYTSDPAAQYKLQILSSSWISIEIETVNREQNYVQLDLGKNLATFFSF